MTRFEKCWCIYMGKLLALKLPEPRGKRLFLYSDPSLPCHPPSYWLRIFSSQTFSRINTPIFLKPSHSSRPPAYEDGTESSETSEYNIQTPENYSEQSIQHVLSSGNDFSCLWNRWWRSVNTVPVADDTVLLNHQIV